MAYYWKESERVFWIAVYVYVTVLIASAVPRAVSAESISRPATLAELSWAAEGNLPNERIGQAQQRLRDHLQWMEQHLPARWGRMGLKERGEWVFQSMHDQLLIGNYAEDQNLLSEALLGGDYNCVSATILYQVLADHAGLPTMAMQTRGHVWCRLLSRPELDIETTCPTWFLLEPHDQDQAPGIQAGDAARALTARGLAAKIPYNRASLAAAKEEYAQAIQLLDRALVLDPQDPAAMKNRVAILNNWAVRCVSQHDCDRALELLEQIEAQQGGETQVGENERRIVDTVIQQWCREGRFADAVRLAQWKPGESRHSVRSIYETWIEDAKSRGEWYEAKNVLHSAMTALSDDPLAVAQLKRQYRHLLPG
ncbi:tetratricopeptide repeat protein [Bremerella cremea]|uniref:Uncharacterized protein n=2 Tax=Pirellulales TaxID=2691354 RepID=A0A2S8FBE5_9BACT|nr:hypothetical protein C5Y83_25840 [Blastopirellula marina]RCS42792.1 tetratricopeptide repeat protein [Bremerella cremea]